jgi:hypothetical protein
MSSESAAAAALSSTNENPSSLSERKKKDVPPLALEDTLRDLAVLRASSVDLAAVLNNNTAGATAAPLPATDASVLRSYEFARAARAAIKIRNRGDVEAQVERVNDVRDKLEDVAAGLRDG